MTAVSNNGHVFTWGDNRMGQLKINRPNLYNFSRANLLAKPQEVTYNIPLENVDKIVSISSGFYHLSAVTADGRVFTWGESDYGKLGRSENQGNDITSRFNLSNADKIVVTPLGEHHSSAISSIGRVFTWGLNSSGELGDGTTTNKSIPTEITSNFNLISGEKISTLFLGSNSRTSAAISSSGRVFTWGSNEFGQLGDGTTGSENNKLIPTEITSNFNLDSGDKIDALSLGRFHS
jgi:alpha-tubulin suppressor-like RCC1 family protein